MFPAVVVLYNCSVESLHGCLKLGNSAIKHRPVISAFPRRHNYCSSQNL